MRMDEEMLDRLLADPPAGMNVVPVGAAADRALRIAAAGVAAGFVSVVEDALAEEEHDAMEAGTRALDEAVVRHLFEGGGEEAMLAGAARQEEVVRAAAARTGNDVLNRLVDTLPDSLAVTASFRLPEIGIERFEHEVWIVASPRGGLLAVTLALSPPQAFARLVPPLLMRARRWAADDELLALEAEACDWCFERWSGDPGRDLEARQRQDLRALEFALAERPSLAGRPPLEHALASDDAAAWPAKQRRVGESFAEAVAGVFEVAAFSGAAATLRGPGGRAEYHVHAPRKGEMRPGWMWLGRIIPFGDGTYVGSPGGVAVRAGARDLASARTTFKARLDELPPGLALEAALAEGVFGARVPRRVLPADGPAAAAERLDEAHEVLTAAGAAETVEASGAAPARVRYAVDDVMAEWLRALHELAHKRKPGRRPRAKGGRGKWKRR